jgi:TP901-1 family phage major tail protein
LTAQKGRNVVLKLNTTGSTYAVVGGARTVTATTANTIVDITNADDAGVRKLLEGAGVNSITFKFQGVYIDDAYIGNVRSDALTNALRNYQIVMPGATSGGTYEGSFQCSSFEESGTYTDAATVTMTLESAGPITFTGA